MNKNTSTLSPRIQSQKPKASAQMNKFWGVWLPVPTVIGVVNTIFWTWLLLSTVGYQDKRLEKAVEWIRREF